jgi:glycosyltransferase involved in cell wall biosynthesis
MPRFSIVIPTLQRADTLRHALATAAAQTCDEVEVVIQNNGRDPETEAVLRGFDQPWIHHFASDTVVTMTDNWEAALANARGDFITFIGDDDGLFPDACRWAAAVIDRTGAEIVSWHPYCYYWPNYLFPELRNRLIATVDYRNDVQVVPSQHALSRFYRFAIDYSRLPMIYNSFVRRSVVERVKAAIGRYFVGLNPDVTSGIVNAAHTGNFALLSRPLSMTGLSHHSVGHNTFFCERTHVSADRIRRDFGALRIDDRLVPLENLQIYLAHDMLLLRDRIPSLRDRAPFDFRRLIQSIAVAINDRPNFYDDTLAAVRELAKRHDVTLDDIAVPAPTTRRQPPERGALVVGADRVRFVIDGDAIPLANIADAIRLMEQLMPPAAIAETEIRFTDTGPAVARRGETLTFGQAGSGSDGLIEGWGEPEAWGTWSIAKRATIHLSVAPVDGRPLHADLRYRTFLHGEHRRLDIACLVRGEPITAWSCDIEAPTGIQPLTIPAPLLAADGTVELEFSISEPRSPAELGVSSDARLLGLGIETLSLCP